jgi:hypothetical protein
MDARTSEADRLVIERRGHPRAGLALVVLGPITGLALIGLTLTFGGTLERAGGVTTHRFTFFEGVLLFLGLVLALGSVPWGGVLAYGSRVVLDRAAGRLDASWSLLGLGARTSRPLADFDAVEWTSEARTQEVAGAYDARRAVTVYPVRLRGRRPQHTRVLATKSEPEAARRLTREVGEFLGIAQVHAGACD